MVFYITHKREPFIPHSKQLGFQDQVLPFSLMCFLAGSMSHADQAVVQVRIPTKPIQRGRAIVGCIVVAFACVLDFALVVCR